MFDGTTLLDVSVSVDALLANDRLTFGGLVDTQTGFVISPIRRAFNRGLTFRLVPRKTGNAYRVEVKGSIHKFHNNGQHNADQFTADDLLLTLDQLVREYGFDLFNSKINKLEFGVNVELPFPVSHIVKNLICYKNQPFSLDTDSDTLYYVCNLQQYAIKIYDKGTQKGLDFDQLRFEIRADKMEYFNGKGIRLDTLADLLNVANYEPLGVLLVDTFNEILFDDPAINPDDLTPCEREIYRDGRNPRFWQRPDNLTFKQANTHRQRMSRAKRSFRALLDQRGNNWQREVSTLISQTWGRLTAVDDNLLTRIDEHRAAWQNLTRPNISPKQPGPTCHKLTDYVLPVSAGKTGATCHELTNSSIPGLSQINPLYSGINCDTLKPDQPPKPGAVVCPVTGVLIERPRPGQRFVSAAMLRQDDDLLLQLQSQSRAYAKGSKEDEYSRAAHNARNRDSNRRNNLRRQLIRHNKKKGGQQSLFPELAVFFLTNEQRAALDYWQGTPYEVRFT
ncbi:hypothetical protein [Spirosoma areae]